MFVSIHSWNKYLWASVCPRCLLCNRDTGYSDPWKRTGFCPPGDSILGRINTHRNNKHVDISDNAKCCESKNQSTVWKRESNNLECGHGKLVWGEGIGTKTWIMRRDGHVLVWLGLSGRGGRNWQLHLTFIYHHLLLGPTNRSTVMYGCSDILCLSHWAFWNVNHIPSISLSSCHSHQNAP